MKKTVVIATLLSLSTVTYAEGWYLGLAYSSLEAELESGGIKRDSNPDGINLMPGYKFSKNFAVEGLLGTGISDDRVENESFDFELKSVLGVSAVGILPLSKHFDLYGKVGFAQVEYDDSDGDSADASGAMFGIGAAFNVTERFGFNLEYVQYPDGEYDDFNIDIEANALNLGVYYNF